MKTVVMTLLTLGFSTLSYGKESAMGAGSSGGGFAVVCRNEARNITSAQLLDLYEAKNKFKYELIESTGSLEGDYVASVRNTYRLQGAGDLPLIGEGTRKNLDLFLEKVIFLGKGQELPKLNDLGTHLPAPIGCEIEPLAVWSGKGESSIIRIKSEIWDNLSTLDQAALVQHELFYAYERDLYEKTSEGTRASVATIFSNNAQPVFDERTEKLNYGSSSDKDLSGKTYITSFRYEVTNDLMTLHLSHIMNRALLTKAIAQISLEGVKLKKEYIDHRGFFIVAETDKVRVSRSKIATQQRSDWEIEFTFIPNKPVKVSFYQKGVLIQESLLNTI